MQEIRKRMTILMADDDADDRMFTREAWEKTSATGKLLFVEDGEELMDYLYRRGTYAQPSRAPRPDLILLDLNMPKVDGREALKTIKTDPRLRQIPVVVLTTSKAEEDIYQIYDLGANSFVSKAVTFDSLVSILNSLGNYWLEVVELPIRKD